MNFLKFFSISICFALAACGGNSSGTQTPIITSAEGIWTGNFSTSSGLLFPSTALITSTGEVGINLGNGVVFTGFNVVDNNQIRISGGESTIPQAIVTLEGTLNSESTLNVEVIQGARFMLQGEMLSYSYDPFYDLASSPGTVEGNWSGVNTFDMSVGDWTLAITADGTFTGNFLGLSITGNISPINSSKNEYDVDLVMASPIIGSSYRGSYNGIATVLESNTTNDTLLIFLDRTLPFPLKASLTLIRN